MLSYVIRRLLYAIPIALAVTVVVFSLVHLAPGDAINALVPDEASAELVNQIRHEYGLDKPLPVQYFYWLGNALRGNLGMSLGSGRPVATETMTAVKNTLVLAVSAGLMSCILGFSLGIAAGVWRERLADHVISFFTLAGVSVPHYWLAIVLVIIFSVNHMWLPPLGMGPNEWRLDWVHFQHMILPTVTMAAIPISVIARTVRANVAEVMDQEFITTLWSKGLTRSRIFWHVIRNVLPGSLAVMGLQIGHMLGGSVLVETVFAWPGTGFLMATAIFQRDLPLLQGTMLVLSISFVLLNLLVDLLQSWADPRLRRIG
ncbi:ABC transporter permease [Sodalis sp. dw_96]|uniref:ABC transporter permease n=1 Tax=Sodalis sp. dw_96 TaxID=2719794 RepID=UPI001BD46F2A|nr:ABC transporter permease [Sodalis sp. dw_96]